MRSGTRNQWSSRSSGVMCSDFLAEHTSWAAAFCTDCNRFWRLPEMPARTEIQWSTLLTTRARTRVSRACLDKERHTLRSWRNEGSNGVCNVSLHADVGVNVDSEVTNRGWHRLHRDVADMDWIRRNDMLTPCGRAPQEFGPYLVHLRPVGFHPPRHVVDAGTHTMCEVVNLWRFTKPTYLSVVCISVWN